MTFIYFILGLGLLVFIHELGHFLVAKWSGVRVEQFSLGFGPKILGFRWGETEYKISILPLGGYVKMAGEEPEEGEITPAMDPRSFAAQALYKRIAIVLAGPAMNLILAMILLPLVFLMGRMEPAFLEKPAVVVGVKKGSPAEGLKLEKGDQILSIDGYETPSWDQAMQRILVSPDTEVTIKIRKVQSSDLKTQPHRGVEGEAPTALPMEGATQAPVIEVKKVKLTTAKEGKVGFLGVEPHYFMGNDAVVSNVSPSSPAEKAGIKAQDKIVAIAGFPIENWDDMSEKVAAAEGKPIDVEILRGSEKINLILTPQYNEAYKKWIIGIGKAVPEGAVVKRSYNFKQAVERGAQEFGRLFMLTMEVLKKLFTFQLSYKTLGGPIQIAEATANAAKSGMGDFFYFLSFMSLQLGVLNLLPIPVLDGGHFLFMLYEGIRRKPMSIKSRIIAQQVGMAFLFGLMILVTINDIDTVWGFKKIFGKIAGWF